MMYAGHALFHFVVVKSQPTNFNHGTIQEHNTANIIIQTVFGYIFDSDVLIQMLLVT